MAAQSVEHNYYTGEKSAYVHNMFSGIADRYDLLNGVLSFNQHKRWRRFAVKLAKVSAGDSALDVCTGTGDFAIDLYNAVGKTGTVIGSDFCKPMVDIGKKKTDVISDDSILMMIADAQNLPYQDNYFDIVTVGFGIRNVVDTQLAFREMARVAKVGGRVVCLEFNKPVGPLSPMVNLYQDKILPKIGAMFSNSHAYKYLPDSINAFHSRETLSKMMQEVGLTNIRVINLNFGSVCIHIGVKSECGSKGITL